MSIYIKGPFNSGTNLLFQILQDEFPSCDQDRKHFFTTDELGEIASKHKVIFLYKKMENWIVSIRKEHYDIQFLTNRRVRLHDIEYKNIIELYNAYYQTYKHFLELYPDNVIFIDYYKLIDPVNGYSYLNERLKKWDMTLHDQGHFYECLSKPSKTHGRPVHTNIEAIKKKESNVSKIKEEIQKTPIFLNSYNDSLYSYFENN